MTAEQNKAVALQYFEETHNERRMDRADAFFVSSAEAARFKRAFAVVVTAFPDAHFTVEDAIAEADTVVLRVTVSGTHTGPWHDWNGFGTIAPTGQEVRINECFIYRMADGKISSEWAAIDLVSMYQQMGVWPH